MKYNLFFILILQLASFKPAHALIGGKFDSENKFPFVIYLGRFQCTASKISARHYLTAAHCVNQMGQGPIIDLSSNVFSKTQVIRTKTSTEVVKVAKIYFHPSWRKVMSPEDGYSEMDKKINSANLTDAAILEFEDDLNVPSVELSFEPVKEKQIIIIGGFGRKSDEPVEGENPDSEKFTYAEVSALDTLNECLVADSKKSDCDCGYAIFRSGDSGGPALIQANQYKYKIIGINSWGSKAALDDSTREVNIMARLDTKAGAPNVKDWLCSIVKVNGCGAGE